MAGDYSGDHRFGPMCVPGDPTPWGIRWYSTDPEPWPGFAQAIQEMARAEELYVFVHSPATAHPTTSGGHGSYSYWPIRDVGSHRCYCQQRRETGSYDEEIVTIHISPISKKRGQS